MIIHIEYDELEKKWKRKCPSCNKWVYHGNKYLCNRSEKEKIPCKSCGNLKLISLPSNIRQLSNGHWVKKCKYCQKEVNQQSRAMCIRNSHRPCNNCRHYGPMSDEHKKKLSNLAKIRWKTDTFRSKLNFHIHTQRTTQIKNRQVIVSYNPSACKFIESLNKKLKTIHFRHQENHLQGEFSCLCYFADGYDEKNNIWFEYDEPHHEKPIIKQRDIIKESRIMGKLKCRIVRYSEKYGIFYERLADRTYRKLETLE